MPGNNQKRLLLEMFENLPGVSFMVLFRTTGDLQLAGWVRDGSGSIGLR